MSYDPDPLGETARYRQKKRDLLRERKLSYTWNSAEESALIVAVHKRNMLWDGGCPDYKISHLKRQCWEEVAAELGIDGIDAIQAKLKWNSMRSNFKSYLGKYRVKRAGQGPEDTITVSWPHFTEMLFIESADVPQTAASTSTLFLEHSSCDLSIFDDSTQFKSKVAAEPALQSARKRRHVETRTPTPCPPSPTPSSQSGSMKSLAVEVLSDLRRRQQDRFTAFGDLIATHLRKLQPQQALVLESRISRVLYDYLDTIQYESSPDLSILCDTEIMTEPISMSTSQRGLGSINRTAPTLSVACESVKIETMPAIDKFETVSMEPHSPDPFIGNLQEAPTSYCPEQNPTNQDTSHNAKNESQLRGKKLEIYGALVDVLRSRDESDKKSREESLKCQQSMANAMNSMATSFLAISQVQLNLSKEKKNS